MCDTSSIGDISHVPIKRFQSGVQKCIVNVYCSLRKECEEENVEMCHSALVLRVSNLLKVPFRKVDDILKLWKTGGDLKTPQKCRKRKFPATCVDSFTEEAIGNKIFLHLSQGKTVTVKSIYEEIHGDDAVQFSGSMSSLRRLIKRMGFSWGRGDKYIHVRESEEVIFKRSCFLRNFSRLQEEEPRKHFVFLDETWLYINGEATKTWLKAGEAKGHPRRPEEGRRLVIVHAGSRNGFIPGDYVL